MQQVFRRITANGKLRENQYIYARIKGPPVHLAHPGRIARQLAHNRIELPQPH